MGRESSFYTEFFLLLASLALAGASVVLFNKLTKDYALQPKQALGLEQVPLPTDKMQPPAPKAQ